MSFRLLYNKILTSTSVIIECISWLINVTDNNDARWKPEINVRMVITYKEYRNSFSHSGVFRRNSSKIELPEDGLSGCRKASG